MPRLPSLVAVVAFLMLAGRIAVAAPVPQQPFVDRVEQMLVDGAADLGLQGTPQRATMVHEDLAIGTVLSVAFAFADGTAEGEVEVQVYASPEAAAAHAESVLTVPEARLEDGSYHVTVRSFAGKRPRTGIEIAVSCATRAPDLGAVSQIVCAQTPAGSQAVVVTRTDGDPIGDLLTLDGRMLAMLPVTDAVAVKVEQAEAAVRAEAEAEAVEAPPPADPRELARAIRDAPPADEVLDSPFGSPGKSWVNERLTVLRDAGLQAVVRTLADSPAAESGIEWWLFDTAAAATAIDAAQQMLAPREAFDRNGHADVWTWTLQLKRIRDGELELLDGIRCAYGKLPPGQVPTQLRCLYVPPGSAVAVVAYTSGTAIPDMAARDRLASAAADALLYGVVRLRAAEASLRIDPAVVGSWNLELPAVPAPARLQLTIAADGSYAFTSSNPVFGAHSGRFRTQDGQWTMTSPTWSDAGSYRLPDADTLVLTGRLGSAAWTRAGGG
ncbi:MAG: hypothetical protein U1E14_04585 [Geminicoccaceae bacterium]